MLNKIKNLFVKSKKQKEIDKINKSVKEFLIACKDLQQRFFDARSIYFAKSLRLKYLQVNSTEYLSLLSETEALKYRIEEVEKLLGSISEFVSVEKCYMGE